MKKCLIVNGFSNWVMHVDSVVLTFNGGSAAEYFEKHYSALGYEVEVKKDRMYSYSEGGSGGSR